MGQCNGNSTCYNSTLFSSYLPICGQYLSRTMCLNTTSITDLLRYFRVKLIYLGMMQTC